MDGEIQSGGNSRTTHGTNMLEIERIPLASLAPAEFVFLIGLARFSGQILLGVTQSLFLQTALMLLLAIVMALIFSPEAVAMVRIVGFIGAMIMFIQLLYLLTAHMLLLATKVIMSTSLLQEVMAFLTGRLN